MLRLISVRQYFSLLRGRGGGALADGQVSRPPPFLPRKSPDVHHKHDLSNYGEIHTVLPAALVLNSCQGRLAEHGRCGCVGTAPGR